MFFVLWFWERIRGVFSGVFWGPEGFCILQGAQEIKRLGKKGETLKRAKDVFAKNVINIRSKTKGPGERGPQKSSRNFVSETAPDFECRLPYDSCVRDRAAFWPFLGEGFWGNIRRPLVLPAPLFSTSDKNSNKSTWQDKKTRAWRVRHASWATKIETPLTSYRVGFGPLTRNETK